MMLGRDKMDKNSYNEEYKWELLPPSHFNGLKSVTTPN
jgi:hypothetical protein